MKRFLLSTVFCASLSTLACSGNGTTFGPDGGPSGTSSSGGSSDLEPSDDDPASSSSSSSSSSGGKSDAGTNPTTTGPVRIKNLAMAGSNPVSLTFALENDGSFDIERIQEFSVKGGSGALTFAVTCESSKWLVAAGGTSGVLDLSVYGGMSSSSATLYYDSLCSSAFGTNSSSFSAASSVTLTIKGLLTDATQWKATATATP